jgi:hypothetical protein
LQRAVLMLRKLNLHGIPREIRNDLRQLQDAYSEELDLDGSDTSSQESIEFEAGEPEENYLEEGRGTSEYRRRKSGTRSQQNGAEQGSASGDRAHGDEKHTVNKDEERTSDSEDREYSEVNLEKAFSHPRSHHHEQGKVLSRSWRWGPGATSNDAAKFFQRVHMFS